jgi:glycosyltransferase involved in cell wall biosynthesis
MRILQIAPLWESVPPAMYGGTEAVVHLLTEELVRLGHDVTLCAAGDSKTSAHLRSCYPRSLRTAHDLEDRLPYVWRHAVFSLEEAGDYDIVHNHAGEEVMVLEPLVPGAPMLTTTHCNIPPDRAFIWQSYRGYFNTISHAQTRTVGPFPCARFAGVAYNGIDVESFPFQREKEDFLLFLGRLSPEKGVPTAIEVARRAGKRLLIAGKVDDYDRAYFESKVAPLLDERTAVYLGEADAVMKRNLYKRASALLMPIVWDEPFGLVMAEAQACGTPVIAFDRGAASEVVCDGESGFLVNTADEMLEALGHVHEINPERCRAWVSAKFDGPAMAARYLEMYEDIVKNVREPRRLTLEARTAESGAVLSEQVA